MSNILHLVERSAILDSKSFLRLQEKSQVILPRNDLPEVVRNRASHSHEVALSSKMMSVAIAEKLGVPESQIDYVNAVENCSLLHDIGHIFSHDGAVLIDNYFKKRGLSEGFSDNNNNLTVIEKNNIPVRDYVIASTIKYPDKLYREQQGKYLPMLQKAVEQDQAHLKDHGIPGNIGANKTLACQIMDEADRNCYVASDLADFLSIGNTLTSDKLRSISDSFNFGVRSKKEINSILELARFGSKSEIKNHFNELKTLFNLNLELGSNGIQHSDIEILQLREYLNKVSFECYITPIRKMKDHTENMMMLEAFIDYVIDKEFYPSNHYKEKIENSSGNEKLRYIRDMVSDVSDWYVIKIAKDMDLLAKYEPEVSLISEY